MGPSGDAKHRAPVRNSCRGTHLGSGHVRPHQQTGHMIASDPIRTAALTSCKPGAVHIWVPACAFAYAGTTHSNGLDMTELRDVFICDAVRTPIGRYGGSLAKVRTDDLAAVPIKALVARNPAVDWSALDEVVLGCANQAGEDNRNVARMALLLAGIPTCVPGVTVNRLCASGLDAVGDAARAIRCGDTDSPSPAESRSMTRAPLVMGKAQEAFQRSADIHDTTLGWRFINPLMKQQYGVDSMAETAGERGRGIPGLACRPGRLRAALAAARWQRQGGGLSSPMRSLRSPSPAARRDRHGRQGRASAAGDHARRAGQARSRSPAIPAP